LYQTRVNQLVAPPQIVMRQAQARATESGRRIATKRMERHPLMIPGELEGAAKVQAMMGHHRDPFAAALIASLPKLRRYAAALVGNVGAADDLVQDCIERALRRSATLHDPRHMAGWLRSILHNLHVDELRRRRDLLNGVEISEMDNALVAPPEDRGANIDFMRAFDTLSFEHKQILLLAGLEGLNYREIGEELGIPIGTVMSRLARARERLRAALGRETSSSPGAQIETLRGAKR
jgi:RNA polymerase sigma-70 factor, ECF subfamily